MYAVVSSLSIPCIATLAALRGELGARAAVGISMASVALALMLIVGAGSVWAVQARADREVILSGGAVTQAASELLHSLVTASDPSTLTVLDNVVVVDSTDVTSRVGNSAPGTTLNYDGSTATTPNFAQAFTLSDTAAGSAGSFNGSGAAAPSGRRPTTGPRCSSKRNLVHRGN